MPARHPKDDRPILEFKAPEAWRKWLAKNHESSDGLWIKFAKKGSGVASVNYQEALEVALCFGWIDSQVSSLDERFYLQRFTPRGKKSKWSKINCQKVEMLISAGLMTARGQLEIDAAKADGRWEQAYGSPSTIEVPPDLAAELKKHPAAAKFFATLKGSNRYAILYRLHDAKRPETRQKRMKQFIEMLEQGKTLH